MFSILIKISISLLFPAIISRESGSKKCREFSVPGRNPSGNENFEWRRVPREQQLTWVSRRTGEGRSEAGGESNLKGNQVKIPDFDAEIVPTLRRVQKRLKEELSYYHRPPPKGVFFSLIWSCCGHIWAINRNLQLKTIFFKIAHALVIMTPFVRFI